MALCFFYVERKTKQLPILYHLGSRVCIVKFHDSQFSLISATRDYIHWIGIIFWIRSNVSKLDCHFIQYCPWTYLQPHYGNGFFLAMFTFQMDNTKRETLPAPHCRNGSCSCVQAVALKKLLWRYICKLLKNMIFFFSSCFIWNLHISIF